MFDQLVPFSEHFKEGAYFTLLDAKVGNEITTEYGDGRPALLKIKTDDAPNGAWFSVFGDAIVNQVDRMEPNELRGGAEVCLTRKSNKAGTYEYKVLATREQVENDDIPF
jgi:hypothetical protein